MGKAAEPKDLPRSRATELTAASTKNSLVLSCADEPAQTPEWTTERWKHQVEAEARSQLKRKVRDVAAAR